MLIVSDVSKSFGKVHAVRGVSFELAKGQVVGLLGPNGAGKTTTIRMVTGFTPPDRGRVSVGGFDTIDQSREARRRIGYLPESAPLYPEMTVAGYLDYRARLFGVERAKRRTAVGSVIDRCWLLEVRARRIGHLSKGYRQRVGLAAALLHDPEVVVLDEPANGLDPTQVVEMRRLITELGAHHTVLVSSHILPEIERVCSRVIVMIRGEVKADGSPAALVAKAPGGEGFHVEVKADGAEAETRTRGVLKGIEGVSAVETLVREGWVMAEVKASGDGDLREAIARSLAGAGLLAREVSRKRASLEQVFMGLLEGGRGAGSGGGAA